MQVFPGKSANKIKRKLTEKNRKNFKKRLDFCAVSRYNMQVTYPGVAKFGIALDWGSRGRRFKSCHSDQLKRLLERVVSFLFL